MSVRRYFVCPLSVVRIHQDCFHPGMAWYAYHLLTAHPDGSTDYDPDHPDPARSDPMVLLSAAFQSEEGEEKFSIHSDVACLPHPQFEGTVRLDDINLEKPYTKGGKNSVIPEADHPHRAKKFRQRHANALKGCRQLNSDGGTDTVLDLHVKAANCWQDMRLRNLY